MSNSIGEDRDAAAVDKIPSPIKDKIPSPIKEGAHLQPASSHGDADLAVFQDSNNTSSLLGNLGELQLQSVSNNRSSKRETAAERRQRLKDRLKLLAELQAARLAKPKFSDYAHDELVLLVVRHGIEIRREQVVLTEALRDLAESLYLGQEIPKPDRYPVNSSNRAMVERGIGSLQRRYIARAWNERLNRQRALEDEELRRLEADTIDYAALARELDDDQREHHQRDDEESAGPLDPTELRETVASAPLKKFKRYLDVEWKTPSWETAKVFGNYNQPRQFGKGDKNPEFDYFRTTTGRHCFHGGCGEQCDYFGEGQVSELGLYGPAITNYFKFIKTLFWLFFVLSIVALPNLILNVYGPTMRTNALGDMSVTTVGNLAASSLNQTVYIRVPGCVEGGYYLVDCEMSKERVGLFYAWLDVIIVVIMCVGFVWLRSFEAREETTLNKFTVSASMFTVIVTGLPAQCDESDVKRHIRTCMISRNHPPPIIVSVNIGFDNEHMIEEAKKRGKVLKDKIHLTELHRYECTQVRNNASYTEQTKTKKIGELRKAYMAKAIVLSASLKAHEKKFARIIAEEPETPICAYVTFNTITDAINCCKAFSPQSLSEWACCAMPPYLLMKGSTLQIARAPEPSTIIWENLRYGTPERTLRRLLTSAVALLVLIISILICFGAKSAQELARSSGGDGLCPQSFNTLSTAQQKTFVDQPGNSQYLHCYCSGLSYRDRATDNSCAAYHASVSRAEAITFFAAVVVLIVNSSLEFAVRYLVKFDKHRSMDTLNKAVFVRIFFLKYINTSGIFLLLNNKDILTFIGVSSRNNTDFSATWFGTIGVTILIVQCINILTGHSYKLYLYWRYRRNLALAKNDPKRALTQSELNLLHLGPEFEVATEYAQLLATFFTCVTFSTGMPLLLCIGACNFFVSYFIDKFLFVRLYRIPPRLDDRLGREAVSIIPLAIIVHVGTSIWILGNTQLFTTSGTLVSQFVAGSVPYLQQKILQQHTFLLLVVFCLVAAASIAYLVVSVFNSQTKAFETTIPRSSVAYHTTFKKAVQRLLIKGEHSYNILLNPKYHSAFNISWNFALGHRHLRSFRLDTVEQQKLAGILSSSSADAEDARVVEHRIRGLTRDVSSFNHTDGSSVPSSVSVSVTVSTPATATASATPRGEAAEPV